MISALRRDALRLLLRPRMLVSIACAGVFLGAFVRATHHSHASEIVAAQAGGALLASLGSICSLLAWIAALVFGILLAHEDRASGLIGQLAIRPVSRVEYAVGRSLGLGYSVAAVTVMIVIVASFASGISGADLPATRRIERADRVFVAGTALPPLDLRAIDRGEVARFEFATAQQGTLSLRLEPKVKAGGSDAAARFSGFVDVNVTVRSGDRVLATVLLEHVRPIGTHAIEVAEHGTEPIVVEIENRTPGALLAIASDQVVMEGEAESAARQIAFAIVLMIASALILSVIGFVLASAFSVGTAALVGSTLFLLGVSHSAVLALVDESLIVSGSLFGPIVRALVSITPDLAAFDVSNRLAAGTALTSLELASLGGLGIAQWLAGIALAAAFVAWRDR